MLGEVDRLVPMVLRSDAEHDVERILVPSEFPERNDYLVASVELKIEPKCRLAGSKIAGQLLALFALFEHGQVRIEDIRRVTGTGGVDQDLSAQWNYSDGNSAQHKTG